MTRMEKLQRLQLSLKATLFFSLSLELDWLLILVRKIQKQVNWGMDQELILMEKKEKDTGMTLMAGGIKKKRVASGITLMVLKPVCQCIKPA